jgi:hypothetical protein
MGYYTGESTSVEVHRYAVRLADGMENVSDALPDGKLPPALIEPEFLGPFAWTMRSSVHVAPAPGGVMMQPDVAGFKTIARVVAVAKPAYAIRSGTQDLPPIEEVGGRQAYHLELHPQTEPSRHNLRDLWIDVRSHDLVKAHFVGTYAPVHKAPPSPTDVTVYFRSVLGCWVVTRAVWTYQDPPISYDFDVQNDEIGLLASLPDWLFDAAAYRLREAAGEPDYLGTLLDAMRKGAATHNPVRDSRRAVRSRRVRAPIGGRELLEPVEVFGKPQHASRFVLHVRDAIVPGIWRDHEQRRAKTKIIVALVRRR